MKKLAFSTALAALTMAQTPDPDKRPAFEVASIRPAQQDGNHDSDIDGGLYRTHNLTLKRLIGSAWGVDAGEIFGGRGWLDSDSYDITARIPAEFVPQAGQKLPQMIQSLLADRFQLVIHREPRQIPGYTLVVAKTGLKMKRAAPDANGAEIHAQNTHLSAENVTMEAFARHLSRNRDLGKPVLDKTGLTDAFTFVLDWSRERSEPSSDDRPSIFTALQEQLGLRLESSRIPILAIVVDRAEKPGDN